jgi:hypothetical protein
MTSRLLKPCAVLLLIQLCVPSFASVLKSHDQFLAEAFGTDAQPVQQTLWLTAELKAEISKRIDYQVSALRLRYWILAERSAWILEEVGKEQPITMGVVVDSDKIKSIDVLIYRESRGEEIKHEFFTRQFTDAKLQESGENLLLSRPIDGITGATLSVRAAKKVAILALFLHRHILQELVLQELSLQELSLQELSLQKLRPETTHSEVHGEKK